MLCFLGTVAFGSLIIAILRMIRVILEKIEEKLAQYHQDNKIGKTLEKSLIILNKYFLGFYYVNFL